MILDDFFYTSSSPPSNMNWTYNYALVALSYIIASFASYVALDIANNMKKNHTEEGLTILSNKSWLLIGALTLGIGIWTMHFIGMEAVDMPMVMEYDLFLTFISLMCAVAASGLAFFIVNLKKRRLFIIISGGVIIGLGIASMHYIGMSAMLNMKIRYTPGLFFLSIIIGILASQAALATMMWRQKHQSQFFPILINITSALILGAAISGMHYTGMSAAVFYMGENPTTNAGVVKDEILSISVGITTLFIVAIGLVISSYRHYMLSWEKAKNHELEVQKNTLKEQQQALVQVNYELSDKEKKTRAILSITPIGIITTNEEGVIETCNSAAEDMFKFSRGEFRGLNIYSFVRSSQTEKFHSFEKLIRMNPHHKEFIGINRYDAAFPIEVSFSKLQLSHCVNYVLTIEDLTERKLTEEKVASLNAQLVNIARQAGMTEVANSVLHNVGNVLNSINVSTSILKEKIKNSELFTLNKVWQLLEDNKDNLTHFLMEDPKGIHILDYLKLLSKSWDMEFSELWKELSSLTNKVEHIKHIIQMQLSLNVNKNTAEEIMVPDAIHDAVVMSNLLIGAQDISLEIDCSNVSTAWIDKIKFLQILVNLIQNAKDSLVSSQLSDKRLIIKAFNNENNQLIIQVIDNGCGISKENMPQLFTFGFTTKTNGHGFGLHYCIQSAKEMGGNLTAISEGEGFGATFSLELPYQQEKN